MKSEPIRKIYAAAALLTALATLYLEWNDPNFQWAFREVQDLIYFRRIYFPAQITAPALLAFTGLALLFFRSAAFFLALSHGALIWYWYFFTRTTPHQSPTRLFNSDILFFLHFGIFALGILYFLLAERDIPDAHEGPLE